MSLFAAHFQGSTMSTINRRVWAALLETHICIPFLVFASLLIRSYTNSTNLGAVVSLKPW